MYNNYSYTRADRGPISNEEGTLSWPTLEQASPTLLSTGWEWVDGVTWVVDEGAPGTDAEGWSYASNFGSISTNSSATKGMTHFVRRRRYTRKQYFNGTSIIRKNNMFHLYA